MHSRSSSEEGTRPSDHLSNPEFQQFPNNGVNRIKSSTDRAEETLESHQVIELQAFIERKTWIEEKIQVI